MITQEHLKSILNYDPETGLWRWKIRSARRINIGDIAGTINLTSGYRIITYWGINYLASGLAFLYMTGKYPEIEADHINGDQSDDRWDNLREATRSQNCINIGIKKNNTSGIPGVYWYKRLNKWCVQITINMRKVTIGYFDNFDDACQARWTCEDRYYGTYARRNSPIQLKSETRSPDLFA